MIWNAIERFGSSLFLFVANLVLARQLSANDFGCVGMLMVFISLSDAIVDGGFDSALIQKKQPTHKDYCTIFYWNILLSVILYGVLSAAAPYIASYYEMPLMDDMLRVLGFILPLNALTLIHRNMLKKQVAFKNIARINLLSLFCGTVLAIIMAYMDWGVWSLVGKSICSAMLGCLFYWTTSIWKPTLLFSWQSFKGLFSFGAYIFLVKILITITANITQLIIAKVTSIATLGYYTQARKMEELPRSTLSGALATASFPIIASIQNEREHLRIAARKSMQMLAFVTIGMMTLLIVIANPLFLILLTEKWSSAVPYFQILCVAGMWLTLFEQNVLLMNSLGHSKMNLKVAIIHSGLLILCISCGSFVSVHGILWGVVVANIISYLISAIKVGSLINYGLQTQIKDISPLIFLSAAIGLTTFSLVNVDNNYLLIIVQFMSFSAAFVLLSHLFRISAYKQCIEIIKCKFRRY